MTTGPGRRAGRAAALVVSVLGTAAQAAAHLAASSHAGHVGGAGSDARMVLAHVLAALLTAGVVGRRGAALRRLARLLDGLLPALPGTVALPALDRTGPAAQPHGRALVGRVLATARPLRGPPSGPPLRPALA